MYKKIILTLLLNTISYSIWGMESDVQEQFTHLSLQDQNQKIDMRDLWIRYTCLLTRDDKDAREIYTISSLIDMLSRVDRPFLSEKQANDWKTIRANAKNGLFNIYDAVIDKESLIQTSRLVDEFTDYVHPLQDLSYSLELAQYVKNGIINHPWNLSWIQQLHLTPKANIPSEALSQQEIKMKRLTALEKFEQKIKKKLAIAQLEAPAILPLPQTAKITELIGLIQPSSIITDKNVTKTILGCLSILVALDLEWFNSTQQTAMQQLIYLEATMWKTLYQSKLYYRWRETLFAWIEQCIKENSVESLCWANKVFPKQFLQPCDLPSPSDDQLVMHRLQALENQKKEAAALFNNYEQREKIRIQVKNYMNENNRQ